MAIFTKSQRLPEVIFKKERDFEREIFDNYKLLFGQKTILIESKMKIESKSLGGSIPDGFLFDFSDQNEPKFYLIEIELATHNFYGHIFPQITKFFAFFTNLDKRQKLSRKIFELVDSDKNLRSEFKKLVGKREVFKIISDAIESNQNILIVIDSEKPELSEIEETYTDTWGKMVSCIVLKKFKSDDNEIYSVEPEFEILDLVGDKKSIEESDAYDEEHHTNGVDQSIIDLYSELKGKVLEINPNLVFNPTKSYISIKRRKNIAYIHFRKSGISLIPLQQEEIIRQRIKIYSVRSLPDSVQKFWNGECAEIMIDSPSGMDEIVSLLIPLISED